MSDHWHLCCDEAGQFEDIRDWEKSIIFGMLVPDNDKDALSSSSVSLPLKECSLQRDWDRSKDMKSNYKANSG